MNISKKIKALFQKRIIKMTFKDSAEGVLIINQDGFVTWANQKVKNKINLEGEHINTITSGKISWPLETKEAIRRQVSSSFVEYIITPLYDGYLITVRELNAKNGIVTEMEKKNSEQIAKIVHDLKSPLAGILGLAEVGLMNLADKEYEDLREYLGLILKTSSDMSQDIDLYLIFFGLKNDVYRIKKDSINLKVLKKSIKAEIEIMFRKQAIKVDVTINSQKVYADYRLLVNVLRNALKNAAEATADGGHITLNISDSEKEIEIKVTNPGFIPEEDIKKIFNTNFSTKEGGNGIGTEIIGMGIEAHGGRVKIENLNEKVVLTMTLAKN